MDYEFHKPLIMIHNKHRKTFIITVQLYIDYMIYGVIIYLPVDYILIEIHKDKWIVSEEHGTYTSLRNVSAEMVHICE